MFEEPHARSWQFVHTAHVGRNLLLQLYAILFGIATTTAGGSLERGFHAREKYTTDNSTIAAYTMHTRRLCEVCRERGGGMKKEVVTPEMQKQIDATVWLIQQHVSGPLTDAQEKELRRSLNLLVYPYILQAQRERGGA